MKKLVSLFIPLFAISMFAAGCSAYCHKDGDCRRKHQGHHEGCDKPCHAKKGDKPCHKGEGDKPCHKDAKRGPCAHAADKPCDDCAKKKPCDHGSAAAEPCDACAHGPRGLMGKPTVTDRDDIKAKKHPKAEVPIQAWRLIKPEDTDALPYLGYATFGKGTVIPEHAHADSTEMLYVTAGAGEMTLAGEKHQLSAGSAIFIPRGTKHDFKVTGDETVEAVQIFLPGSAGGKYIDWPDAE